jgi:hypothetical protein
MLYVGLADFRRETLMSQLEHEYQHVFQSARRRHNMRDAISNEIEPTLEDNEILRSN